jgi:peptidoglycan/LPS O-acetylase OafA/YrhL
MPSIASPNTEVSLGEAQQAGDLRPDTLLIGAPSGAAPSPVPVAAAKQANARDKRIDCLRGIAVLSVILAHSVIPIPIFFKAGWMGVDLFFVLSGFLISGLLFRDYQQHQSIDVKRFLVRRGFKIYPSFWLFLAVTWGISVLRQETSRVPLSAYLHELFFVQNYFSPVWVHTWSLAVEEHFYLLLPVFLVALIRLSRDDCDSLRGRDPFHGRDPFRGIVWSAVAIGVGCILSRAALILLPSVPLYNLAYRATHARMDSLFFGVLLGYLHHYHRESLVRTLQSTFTRVAIGVACVALLLPGYFAPRDHKAFAIFAYSSAYLACGGILLLSVYVRGVLPQILAKYLRPFGDALAFIGVYSYSIYLWHDAVREWPDWLVYGVFGVALPPVPYFLLYLALCLIMGITLSRSVEYPILRLRDRLFPEHAAGYGRPGR